MVAEGLSFVMRDDANIPSEPAVERLIAARIAHGDSPHTVRALRGDLAELCGVPRAAGDDARRPAAASRCAAGRRGSPRAAWRRRRIARQLSSARALFADLVRRERARRRSVARARRPAPPQAAARAGDGRRLQPAARRHLERRRAQPARSRDARAAVRLRPARQRGLRARARRPTTPSPAACA